MAARKPKNANAKKSEYKRTPQEVEAVERIFRKPSPRMKFLESSEWVPDHPDVQVGVSLLMEAIGTTDPDFVVGFLGQLANLGDGKNKEGRLNFMLSIIKGIKPRDQIEAMLAAQMAAVHDATMKIFPQLWMADFVPQRDSAERTLNKLMRTFVTQIEALKRYRTGGEQKVTVQHVTVSEGGQAIVGNVTQERREGASGKPVTPQLAIEDTKMVAMPPIEAPAQAPIPLRASSKRK